MECSNMDLILDLMPEENIAFDVIESGKTNEYYQGQAEHILKHIDTNEHYFHFISTILKNFHTLSDEQKQKIIKQLNIPPVIKEKVIIKEKIVYKQAKKVNLNTYDDY